MAMTYILINYISVTNIPTIELSGRGISAAIFPASISHILYDL